jgi:signal transduction protein with GAF and PtsI domain
LASHAFEFDSEGLIVLRPLLQDTAQIRKVNSLEGTMENSLKQETELKKDRGLGVASATNSVRSTEQELEVLYQISASISSHLELDEVLSQIIGLVHQVTHCDACLLYLLDESNRELVLQASKKPHPEDIGNIRLKLGEGITGWVAQEQQVVAITQNASKDSRFKFFFSLPEDRYEAFLSVPVTVKDKVIGVINVQHQKPRQHSQAEIKLISIIGQQVGSAIENARLYEETRKRAQQIESLLRVSETVSSNKYIEEMLNLIVKLCADMINASVCSIMLVDETKQELVIKAARCSNEEYLKKPPVKIHQSLLGRVIRDRQMVMIRDVAEEPEYQYPELAKKEGLRSLVAMPLIVKDQAIGVINCYTSLGHQLSKEEIQMLSSIGHQAGLAIENTRLAAETLAAQKALESRKLVERAKGILQAEANLSEEEAYKRIQQQSRRLRKPMKEIAEAIILASEFKRMTPMEQQSSS